VAAFLRSFDRGMHIASLLRCRDRISLRVDAKVGVAGLIIRGAGLSFIASSRRPSVISSPVNRRPSSTESGEMSRGRSSKS
jgi:hypothetical protein